MKRESAGQVRLYTARSSFAFPLRWSHDPLAWPIHPIFVPTSLRILWREAWHAIPPPVGLYSWSDTVSSPSVLLSFSKKCRETHLFQVSLLPSGLISPRYQYFYHPSELTVPCCSISNLFRFHRSSYHPRPLRFHDVDRMVSVQEWFSCW